jgi:hypothetical protein
VADPDERELELLKTRIYLLKKLQLPKTTGDVKFAKKDILSAL